MELLENFAVQGLPVSDGPLTSLGDGFAARFHSWHGASGRRYVMSIFTDGLPEFEACLVVAVAREGRARRPLGIHVIERGSDLRRVAVQTADADEWHVHFLAADRRDRATVAADLRDRHFDGKVALSA